MSNYKFFINYLRQEGWAPNKVCCYIYYNGLLHHMQKIKFLEEVCYYMKYVFLVF